MGALRLIAQGKRLRVTRGAALWLLGIAAFGLLSLIAALFGRFPGDEFLANRLQSLDVPGLGGAFDFVNLLGYAVPATILGFAAGGYFFLRRQWVAVALIALSGAGRVLHLALRELVERPRPSPELVQVTERVDTFGFPSGHVVGAVVFFGALFYLAPRAFGDRRLAWLLRAFCAFVVVMAGPARVYAGAHWPSDVLGGYLFGALFLAGMIGIDRAHGPAED